MESVFTTNHPVGICWPKWHSREYGGENVREYSEKYAEKILTVENIADKSSLPKNM